MEPAHLLLAAEVCGGRNPHACHGLGHFSFALSGGLAPCSSPASQHGNAATCGGQVSHHCSELVCSVAGDGE